MAARGVGAVMTAMVTVGGGSAAEVCGSMGGEVVAPGCLQVAQGGGAVLHFPGFELAACGARRVLDAVVVAGAAVVALTRSSFSGGPC